MTQAIIRPTAPGDEANCVPTGAATNWECVDEESPEGDLTYVSNLSGTSPRDLHNLGDLALAGKINYIRAYINARRTAALMVHARTAIKLGATIVEGSDIALTNTYADYYTEHVTKPGGGAWTFADINNLQAGVHLNIYSVASFSRCLQLWVVVDYDLALGRSFGHIIG